MLLKLMLGLGSYRDTPYLKPHLRRPLGFLRNFLQPMAELDPVLHAFITHVLAHSV